MFTLLTVFKARGGYEGLVRPSVINKAIGLAILILVSIVFVVSSTSAISQQLTSSLAHAEQKQAAEPDGCTPGNWTAAAPVPTPISRHAFAQNGDDFYLLGILNTYKYNVGTDTWTTLAPIQRSRISAAAAYYGGKIYVAGGRDDDPFNGLDIYDIATNSWTAGPNMPSWTYGAAAGAYNGKVYVAGGMRRQNLQIYDIATSTWSFGNSMPVAYESGGYTQVGQYLYAMGGFGNGSTVSQRLDMALGVWSTGPTWTPARTDFALVSIGSKLYAIGGAVAGVPSDQVNELDITNWPGGTWTLSPPNLPSPRRGNFAGFSNGRIWSTGGLVPGGSSINEHLYRTVACGSPTATPSHTTTTTPVASTPTGTPNALLTGHVTWQGPPSQPNTRQQLPITLTLKSGNTEINYPPQTTDTSGYFTVSITGIPNGTYQWRAKGPRYLANTGTVTLGGLKIVDYRLKIKEDQSSLSNLLSSIQQEMGLMRAADANNDNVVNTSDFTILKSSFGKSPGDPGYDSRADFNNDDIVSLPDFNLLKTNFGQTGAPPL